MHVEMSFPHAYTCMCRHLRFPCIDSLVTFCTFLILPRGCLCVLFSGFFFFCSNEPLELSFALPLHEPFPHQLQVKVLSDRWVGVSFLHLIPLRHSLLPDKRFSHTPLLDLHPLPKTGKEVFSQREKSTDSRRARPLTLRPSTSCSPHTRQEGFRFPCSCTSCSLLASSVHVKIILFRSEPYEDLTERESEGESFYAHCLSTCYAPPRQ